MSVVSLSSAREEASVSDPPHKDVDRRSRRRMQRHSESAACRLLFSNACMHTALLSQVRLDSCRHLFLRTTREVSEYPQSAQMPVPRKASLAMGQGSPTGPPNTFRPDASAQAYHRRRHSKGMEVATPRRWNTRAPGKIGCHGVISCAHVATRQRL